MKQQKKITKQNGITLISLVITIVILLILAGVAVSITVDENGVFKHAKNATEKWEAKVTEEQTEFDKALGYLDNLGGEDEPELNEYGFYFGVPYSFIDPNYGEATVIFTHSKAIMYSNGTTNGIGESVVYSKNVDNVTTITFNGMTGTMSENGEKFTVQGMGEFTLGGSEYIIAYVEEGDYAYTYLKKSNGWNAKALDKTKTTYEEIKSGIKGKPVVDLEQAFTDCANLKTAPKIPSSVTNISKIFLGCINLEGTVTIDGYITDYSNCFSGTQKQITLTGASKNLENIARYYHNVTGTAPVTVTVTESYPEGWDYSKLSGVAVAGNAMAPIPKGFTVSSIEGENSITGGLVIYQGVEEVTNANHSSALTTRNQYVWIPVDDINQMVMCKSNTSTSICNIKSQANGSLKCEKHNSEELCGRLYQALDGGIYYCSSGTMIKQKTDFENRSQTWESSEYREPDLVVNDSLDFLLHNAGIESGKEEDFEAQLKEDFEEMAASVAKYGGFYVGRYEAGVGGASKKGQVVITAADSDSEVEKGLKDWYGLYKEVRKDITDEEENGVVVLKSHMIYGSQYDQIIRFIGSEADEGHIGSVLPEQCVTGSNETDKLNNIYDLEGNNYDWTAQAYIFSGSPYHRVYRGDCFSVAYYPSNARCGAFIYSSTTTSVYNDSDSDMATRAVLYITF